MAGIIAEYDPLHNGHAWHIAQARAASGDEPTVVVMSCCFTQRGMPVLLSPHARAEMALRAGADIVLGLPVSFSVCEAERFALGGVSILARTGLVHSLSFGVEPGNEDCILPAAQLLETPDSTFQAALRKGLDQGLPFPRAQGEALATRLGLPPDCLAAPNTVLAICYARANLRLNTGLALHPIPRRGAYHADTLPDESETALPSATAVRAAILQHAWPSVRRAMPEAAYAVLHARDGGEPSAPPGCAGCAIALDATQRARFFAPARPVRGA